MGLTSHQYLLRLREDSDAEPNLSLVLNQIIIKVLAEKSSSLLDDFEVRPTNFWITAYFFQAFQIWETRQIQIRSCDSMRVDAHVLASTPDLDKRVNASFDNAGRYNRWDSVLEANDLGACRHYRMVLANIESIRVWRRNLGESLLIGVGCTQRLSALLSPVLAGKAFHWSPLGDIYHSW